MPNAIGYKTLVNVEIGFLYVWLKLRLKNSTQNGNMKKNVLFSPLFLYNLALITHDATKSVNPSIENSESARAAMQMSYSKTFANSPMQTKGAITNYKK